ncbi:MAG: hypothetical protein AAB974_01740 [Patescibacteria group bacterium]
MGKLYFDLSTRTPEQIAQIISAVPEDWCWLDGTLDAPQKLIDDGLAHPDAGYVLGGFVERGFKLASLHEYRHGRRSDEPIRRVDTLGIVTVPRLPAFVGFNEAGYRESFALPLPEVVRIAADLVRQGYLGGLSFFSGFRNNNKYDNPERARFQLVPSRELPDWSGVQITPRRELSPFLLLAWDPRHRGTREHLKPIIAACEAQGARFLGDTPDGWAQQMNAVVTA